MNRLSNYYDLTSTGQSVQKAVNDALNAIPNEILETKNDLNTHKNDTDIHTSAQEKLQLNDSIAEINSELELKANEIDVQNRLDEKQPIFITGVTNSGANITTKIVTTTNVDTTYVPVAGDIFIITYSLGQSTDNVLLNINNSGGKYVMLRNILASGVGHGTSSGGCLMYYFDGSSYHLIGSQQQTDTTYTEVATAEIDDPTSSSRRLITGRRLEYFKNNNVLIDEDDFISNTTTKAPTQKSTKAYIDGKVNSIPQPDWTQTDEEALDFIKNKPEWVKGIVSVDDINIVMDTGIYGVDNGALLFVCATSDGSIHLYLEPQEGVWASKYPVNEDWSTWERLTYQSDLTPILSDIVALQNGKLNKTGGKMSGDIDMGGHMIRGLAMPSRNTDATNMVFVENLLSHKPSATAFTSIEVVDEYPDVEVEGVLYLKKVTT